MISMKIRVISAVLVLSALSGCGYKEYAAAKTEFARAEAERMKSAGDVIERLSAKLLPPALPGSPAAAHEPIYVRSVEDVTDLGVTERHSVYPQPSGNDALVQYLIAKENAQLLTELVKVVYTQQQLDIEAPTDAGKVAAKLVETIPFVAAVSGLSWLGGKAADLSGDRITASVTGGGAVSSGGSPSGAYNAPVTTTTTSETTEVVE